MTVYNIVIADDNEDSREILTSFLSYMPDVKVVSQVKDGKELFELVSKQEIEIDLVLADIGMPNLNGMEAIKLCTKFIPNLKFIFITGYNEYAVEAFNISAIDYVVKPIEQQRLFEAIQKAFNLINLENDCKKKGLNNNQNKLILRKGRSTFYIPINAIYFIEKSGKETVIHTKNETYTTLESLKTLSENISHPAFFQTHRSYIVNLNHVRCVETIGKTYLAYFDNYPETAHISKLKISEVQKLIQ
ncbi:LytR/AlgR family response regulator transcription factor [Halalkalibacter lacteus]|uniref:LytR/AlgR family response regulator transcription factor n=1 Tax=Halalkalibacter lacteus TaxID=3090663 RepID=UPI002FCCA4AF